MIENFKTEISKLINLTETEWLVFSKHLITKHYKKGDFFIQEGDICKYVGFIDKGFFNIFYRTKGAEHIRGFFFPNELISNYPSFLLMNESKFNIQALEDSSATLLLRDDLVELYKKIPKVEKFSRFVVESLYIEVSDKYESFFLKTAEERYLEFINSKPKFSEKIPQYMIASYLGITPEALSRVKKRVSKQ
jgi:CRP-like cAMP-binding protein|tara:strand:+ start:56 stop:631 length:576 start_codon:yes stop_codon:yes gene_type:complete